MTNGSGTLKRLARCGLMAVAAAGVLTAVTTANPPSKAEAYSSPSVWVGSPVDATWGTSVDTTPAGNHHKLLKAKPPNDWSVDLPTGGKASPVTLYVAPSNSAYNSNVTTRVTQIIDDNACKNGGGGDMVTVSIYFNGSSSLSVVRSLSVGACPVGDEQDP